MLYTIDRVGDESFPPERTLRAAHGLADLLGPRARGEVASLFDRECSTILGAGDRQELLDDFLAARPARLSRLLTSLGLACSPEEPCLCEPGTWTLTVECDGPRFTFMVSGIRTPSGVVTSARMTGKVFLTPSLAWREIANAAGVAKQPKPFAKEWRRIWDGFEYRSRSGERRRAVGIRLALRADLRLRANGGRHDAD